ncbi:MAG TPA: flagellar biosynthetic protein FliR [Candidatus Hydrogenedentes bacterium]|nr:flagellar biosynthetic protein FliR [Candidatus Hydrogenedentota bacterium]HOV74307.1 flagellar biosynthetic protein FliR [Candidatus Hydrogenedentota bacterium]HPC15000.1 flagellar biosynthetic protein FliR [Candidatus Hydrogenedentota bacterium]HRT19139.1 flagellar biosynthetic protein FliR [Candidatus Hydrogenedentota bacterium]HRT64068.1 flagellar biosynthetic protein FliR [Candidatus Hydrogenedentota bacterium]
MIVYEVEIVKLFILVMARVSGLIVSAPVLGSANFPAMGKIGLVGLTAALIAPTLAPLHMAIPDDPLAFALVGAGEFLIGLLMGFVMTIVFGSIQVAGQIMDMQTGFGMMNVFNPALETQFPIFGFFLFIVAVLVLLATNGHHLMLRALASTYDQIPLGGFVLRPKLIWEVSQWGRAMFYDGLMIAAPVGAAMLVAYVVMGLVGRVVPQIQLFVVGFPVTIALSLVVVAVSLELYIGFLDGMYGEMFSNVSTVIQGMRP